ncbi:reprolysin-like metallopeptidase [Streptomyces monticola]|uniref:Reprolysin-like metallopeptidase n=1 Tax=Streptomyces monticola TaxID=2666263 RepID=A0ABW2JNN8_9ACTN
MRRLTLTGLCALTAALLTAAPLAAPASSLTATASSATATSGPDPDRPWVVRSTTLALRPEYFTPLCHRPDAGLPEELGFRVPLRPEGVVFQAVADYSSEDKDGTVFWSGHHKGHPERQVFIHVTHACDGGPVSLYGSADLGRYQYNARPVDGRPGVAVFEEIDPAELPSSEGDDVDMDPAAPTLAIRPDRPGAGVVLKKATPQAPAVIDVVVGFTPLAAGQAREYGSLQSTGADIEHRMNTSLSDSGVPARINVVHVEEFEDYTGHESTAKVLDHLKDADDEELGRPAQKLRDRLGADLVTVVTDWGSGTGTYPFSAADLPGPGTDHKAFSAVGFDSISSHSSSHELGHNLGLAHDRGTALNGGTGSAMALSTRFPYNTGWIAPDKSFRTIMAYGEYCDGCERIGRFSDQRQKWHGRPLGDEKNDSAGVLRVTTPLIAAYRRPAKPPKRHALKVGHTPKSGGSVRPRVWGPYRPGDRIKVMAEPEKGFRFTGWTLDGKKSRHTGPELILTMNKPRALTARFAPKVR